MKISSFQDIKSEIPGSRQSEDKMGDAPPKTGRAPPCLGRGNAAHAAFPRHFGRARFSFARGPLCPGAYKYPPGVFSASRSEFKQVVVILFYVVIVVVVLLLVLGLSH